MMGGDSGLRLAGSELGLDIREGLSNGRIEGLRRGFGASQMIPQSLMGEINRMAPERSEPGYSQRGGYQPEVTYGA
jgi:hypothetical protein